MTLDLSNSDVSTGNGSGNARGGDVASNNNTNSNNATNQTEQRFFDDKGGNQTFERAAAILGHNSQGNFVTHREGDTTTTRFSQSIRDNSVHTNNNHSTHHYVSPTSRYVPPLRLPLSDVQSPSLLPCIAKKGHEPSLALQVVTLLREKAELAKQKENLSKTNARLIEELAKRSTAASELEAKDRELASALLLTKTMEGQITALERETKALVKDKDDLMTKLDEERRQVEELEQQLLQQTRYAAQSRNELQQLQDSRLFEGRFDGDEVIRMLQHLNTQVFETAKSVTETLALSDWHPDDEAHWAADWNLPAIVTEHLGGRMVWLLESGGPTALADIQLAIQAGLMRCSQILVDHDRPPHHDPIISEAHTRARIRKERAATNGRTPENGSRAIDVASWMARLVVAVLAVSGRTERLFLDMVTARFEGRFATIRDDAARIRKAIREWGSAGEEMQVRSAPWETIFNPAIMEDELADSQGTEEDRSGAYVLCTTALGLDGSKRIGELGVRITRCLLKPKVVLEESVLEELMVEPTH